MYKYITRVLGVCGGSSVIVGTRVPVRAIAYLYKSGESVEEIQEAYPHIPADAIREAISYYEENRQEIEQEMRENTLEWVLSSGYADFLRPFVGMWKTEEENAQDKR